MYYAALHKNKAHGKFNKTNKYSKTHYLIKILIRFVLYKFYQPVAQLGKSLH